MRVLVVTSAFGGHQRGSRITDPKEIETVLAGENSAHVIAAEHPDESAPMEPDETDEHDEE